MKKERQDFIPENLMIKKKKKDSSDFRNKQSQS